MKKRLLFQFFLLTSFALLLVLLSSGTTPVTAQQPQPTAPLLHDPEGAKVPYRTANGLWVMPAGSRTPAQVKTPKATGGPDQYGYTWNDTVAFSWIDATTGTNTGMNGQYQQVGPIPLPFNFPFYENTYSGIYISTNGTLGFNNQLNQAPQQRNIPSPAIPNDVIAPYWAPSDASTGGVYYLSGGTAPNRWFAVEWYQVRDANPSSRLTFEAILYENGDILFQYQTMTYVSTNWCASAGIEDSFGLDGIAYISGCSRITTNNKAVRFYRPPPSARVSVYPPYTGRFATTGAIESFQFQVRNTGDVGTDTYNLSSISTWPISLYAADGVTPVSSTGPLAQGGTFTGIAKINVPAGAVIGNNNTATITAQSTVNPSKQGSSVMQLAVPAPFAQAYRDGTNNAMSLYLVQPNMQTLKKATDDWYVGYPGAVAEMPSSFVYAWHRTRIVDSLTVREIEYTLLDRRGNITKLITKLTDHSGATMSTSDYRPAVAVAPNGRIGILWYRYLWNSGTSQFNYNIWFAILDAAGNVLVSPTNITNNAIWGTLGALNVPYFSSPRIAATDDNRFVLAWLREHQESGGLVDDIYYAVRDSNGNEIKAPTKLTNGTPDTSRFLSPALTSVSPNRVFLSWANQISNSGDIYYAVIDSAGDVIKTATGLTLSDDIIDWWNNDAIQLVDGKILAVWEAWGCAGEWVSRIRFALIDTSYNRIGTPTCLVPSPSAKAGDYSASVTTDTAGRGIITWMDRANTYLYYSLVGNNGSVLTPPMIFRSSSYIDTNYDGYGNTSYHFFPLFLPLILK
jgi:hypothetical protein